jgi:hypothetical protein
VVLDALHQLLVEVVPSQPLQVIAQDVALCRNEHHQRRNQSVHIDIGHGEAPHADYLVDVGEFVERRGMGVVRVPRPKRQSVLLHGTIQNGEKRPQVERDYGQHRKRGVNESPRSDARLENSLLGEFRLEHRRLQFRHLFFEDAGLEDEVAHFDGRQPVGEDHEDYRGEGLQVGVDQEDVSRLEDAAAADDKVQHCGVQGVEVWLVAFCASGPKTHDSQNHDVCVDYGLPLEFGRFFVALREHVYSRLCTRGMTLELCRTGHNHFLLILQNEQSV